MIRVVWVTGRAGTGKSTLTAALDAQLRARGHAPLVLCDEQLLLDLARADVDHDHHWHPHGDERIAFRDGHLFDEGLRLINTRLLDHLAGSGLALVELARGRHAPPIDVTYHRALQLVDRRVWHFSTVLRLDVAFGDQLARNRRRAAGTGRGTPEEIMYSLYSADDPESLTAAGIPVMTLPGLGDAAAGASWILATFGPSFVMRPLHVGRRRVGGPTSAIGG